MTVRPTPKRLSADEHRRASSEERRRAALVAAATADEADPAQQAAKSEWRASLGKGVQTLERTLIERRQWFYDAETGKDLPLQKYQGRVPWKLLQDEQVLLRRGLTAAGGKLVFSQRSYQCNTLADLEEIKALLPPGTTVYLH